MSKNFTGAEVHNNLLLTKSTYNSRFPSKKLFSRSNIDWKTITTPISPPMATSKIKSGIKIAHMFSITFKTQQSCIALCFSAAPALKYPSL